MLSYSPPTTLHQQVINILSQSRTSTIDAQLIYSMLLDWLKKKDLQCNKFVGMSFDGAATFAGKKRGVQAHLKKHMHPIQSSSTATVTSFNWLVFNLQTALRESNTCIQHSLHCGNFFAIRQRDVRI